MKRFVWVTNTHPGGIQTPMVGQTMKEAQESHRELLGRFFHGSPKATDHCSVDQLRGMGMIGLYRIEGDDDSDEPSEGAENDV